MTGPDIGVRAGGDDDALHILSHGDNDVTLCGNDAASRNVVVFAPDMLVDPWAVCWTCAAEAKRLLPQADAR